MRQAALGALFVVGLATACGGDGDTTPVPEVSLADASTSTATTPSTSTSTSTTTASPTPTVVESTTTLAPTTTTTAPPDLTDEEQIIALIDRYWTAIIAAHDPPDPDSPLFDDVAGPTAAQQLRETAASRLAEGKGLRQNESLPVVTLKAVLQEGADGRVLADVCYRDSAVTYALETGEVLDDSVIFIHAQLVLELAGARWFVLSSLTQSEYEEEATCIESLS